MPTTETTGEDTLVYKAGLVILLGIGAAFGFVLGVSTSRPAATRPPQSVAAVTPTAPTAPTTTQPEPPAPTPASPAPGPATKIEPTPAPAPEPKKPEPTPAPVVTAEPKTVEPKKPEPKKKAEPKTVAVAGPAPTFDKDILPIFKDKCNECHGAVTTKGGLDLRTYAALMKGGDGGPEVTPGNPDKSYLWEVIANGSMPPPNKSKLTKEQIDKIKAWIVAGAK